MSPALMSPGTALLTAAGGEGQGREGISPTPAPMPAHSRGVLESAPLRSQGWITCTPITRIFQERNRVCSLSVAADERQAGLAFLSS